VEFERRLLQADEVAAMLGVSVQRVYALAREGLLPSVKLGRQVRFDSKQLEEWIKSGGTELINADPV
jgi:excisionase family DNA binding protein